MPWTKSGFQKIHTQLGPGFEWTGRLASEKLAFDVDLRSVNSADGLRGKIEKSGRWTGPPGGGDGDPGECVTPSYGFGEFRAVTASEAASIPGLRRDGSSVFVTDYGALVHFSGGRFAASGVVIDTFVETSGTRFRAVTNAAPGAVARYAIFDSDPGPIRFEDLENVVAVGAWVDAGPSKHVRAAAVDPLGLRGSIAEART